MKTVLALVLLVLVLVGCGGGSTGSGDDDGSVSVREAIERGSSEEQDVSGYVIERGGERRFCEAILESDPPQCGEPSLRLEGAADAPRDEHVTLRGTVDGAVFRVSEP